MIITSKVVNKPKKKSNRKGIIGEIKISDISIPATEITLVTSCHARIFI